MDGKYEKNVKFVLYHMVEKVKIWNLKKNDSIFSIFVSSI